MQGAAIWTWLGLTLWLIGCPPLSQIVDGHGFLPCACLDPPDKNFAILLNSPVTEMWRAFTTYKRVRTFPFVISPGGKYSLHDAQRASSADGRQRSWLTVGWSERLGILTARNSQHGFCRSDQSRQLSQHIGHPEFAKRWGRCRPPWRTVRCRRLRDEHLMV